MTLLTILRGRRFASAAGAVEETSVKRILFVLLTSVFVSSAFAQGELSDEEITELLAVKIRTVQHIALNPVIVRAVRRQNLQGITERVVQERDRVWQETDDDDEFKRSLQENKPGRLLRKHVSDNTSFNEAFLTDGQGANVAAFPPTSDYFQGDEEKWSSSFNGGDGQLFVGPLERDDSTKVYAVQVSAPVIDKGATIGVLVVGVTLDYLDAKRGQ